jgi:hypothetical protein
MPPLRLREIAPAPSAIVMGGMATLGVTFLAPVVLVVVMGVRRSVGGMPSVGVNLVVPPVVLGFVRGPVVVMSLGLDLVRTAVSHFASPLELVRWVLCFVRLSFHHSGGHRCYTRRPRRSEQPSEVVERKGEMGRPEVAEGQREGTRSAGISPRRGAPELPLMTRSGARGSDYVAPTIFSH